MITVGTLSRLISVRGVQAILAGRVPAIEWIAAGVARSCDEVSRATSNKREMPAMPYRLCLASEPADFLRGKSLTGWDLMEPC
jgi:hypothetical protein